MCGSGQQAIHFAYQEIASGGQQRKLIHSFSPTKISSQIWIVLLRVESRYKYQPYGKIYDNIFWFFSRLQMMGRVPMGTSGPQNPKFSTPEQIENYRKVVGFEMLHQGQSAELICDRYDLSREGSKNRNRSKILFPDLYKIEKPKKKKRNQFAENPNFGKYF